MSLSDEEQLDQLKSFGKKYGSAMISGILIALIAFFGWEYWQKKNLAEPNKNTSRSPIAILPLPRNKPYIPQYDLLNEAWEEQHRKKVLH